MATKELEIQVRLRDLVTKNLTAIQSGFVKLAYRAKQALNSITSSISGLMRWIFSLKGALVGMATTGLVAGFINAAAGMETFRMQLQAVIGDQQRANAVFMELRDFAAKSPVGTEDLIEGYIMLRRIGVENLDVVIKKISEVALVSNRSVTETAQAFVSLEKETLRRLGIEIERTANKAVLSSGEGAKKITIQVNNSVSDIRKALIQIWTKQLPDAMALASNTFKGKMEGLKGSIQLLMADIGELYLPKIKEFVSTLDQFIQKHHNDILAFFSALPEIWDSVFRKLKEKFEIFRIEMSKYAFFNKDGKIDIANLQNVVDEADLREKVRNAQPNKSKYSYEMDTGVKQQEISLLDEISSIFDVHRIKIREKNNEIKKSIDLQSKENIAVSSGTEKVNEYLKKVQDVRKELQEGFSSGKYNFVEKTGFLSGIHRELADVKKAFTDWTAHGRLVVHNLAYGIKDSMAQSFADIIRGTKSVSEAFADMGNRILDVFAQLISEIAVQQSLGFLFGNISGWLPKPSGTGLIGNIFGMANGGVLAGGIKLFASGSPLVDRPTLGFVGEGKYNEAVIPLPDGRRVPVDMRGEQTQGGGNTIIVIQALDGSGIQRVIPQLVSALRKELKTNGSFRSDIKNV